MIDQQTIGQLKRMAEIGEESGGRTTPEWWELHDQVVPKIAGLLMLLQCAGLVLLCEQTNDSASMPEEEGGG